MVASKKQIQEWLDELSGLEAKIEKHEAKYRKETLAAQLAFDEATAPAARRFAEVSQPLFDGRNALKKRIEEAILANRDNFDDPKLRAVVSSGYLAEATVTEKREVPAEAFFKTYQKRPGFWDAVTVAIGRAEKLIGKADLDAIATKVRSWKVDIRKAA